LAAILVFLDQFSVHKTLILANTDLILPSLII